MPRQTILPPAVCVFIGFALLGNAQAQAPQKQLSADERLVNTHAQSTLDEGRRIFRFDTFGSEAFWGDALQLHKAIAGEKNGGVGGGVSPKTALSVAACRRWRSRIAFS